MEARALKSSFLSQMAMNSSPHMFHNDDVWCLTMINSVAADDFPVEDLLNLDLSVKEFEEGFSFSQEAHQFPQKELSNNSSSTFAGVGEFDSLSELAIPVEDLDNLEWLSHFVDDSTSGLSLLCPTGSFSPGVNSGKRAQPVSRPPQIIRSSRFPLPVQGEARSTRSSKLSVLPWTLTSPLLPAVETSTTRSSSHDSSNLPHFELANSVQDTEWFSRAEKPPAMRLKRKAEPEGVSGRRCTHCQVQKTPQWRTGPLGPKTLCNACGVRFKSGRLFPEYRPACSPTFSKQMHSNSHRKVLEMRRKKEGVAQSS